MALEMDVGIMAIPFIIMAVVWGGWIIYKDAIPRWREKRRQREVVERGKGVVRR